jgi:hypothetical protein
VEYKPILTPNLLPLEHCNTLYKVDIITLLPNYNMPSTYGTYIEVEPSNTPYTISAYQPPQPPSRWTRWLPDIFTRIPVTYPNAGPTYQIPSDSPYSTQHSFRFSDLKRFNMPLKSVKLRSGYFPADMRCIHVTHKRYCTKGCYFIEKGGVRVRTCKRVDCMGHVYMGKVLEDKYGRSCFGKKGERLVSYIFNYFYSTFVSKVTIIFTN